MIGQGLTLVTGPTGSGKTARVVDWLLDVKDRPIYTMGIPDLTIEHYKVPPVSEWVEMRPSDEDPSILLPYFAFPAGSIVVIDEAQRLWRPRPPGSKPPAEIQAFETRRHVGVDFVVLTQHPNLIDANVRRLVNRHIHIHCTFLGRYELEWPGCRNPDEKSDRSDAARRRYKPPVRTFSQYKSAEIHTKPVVKRPWYYYALPVLSLALLVGGSAFYSSMKSKFSGAPVDVSAKASSSPVTELKTASVASDYVEQYRPRVDGLVHTAPVYDKLTEPVEAPIIAGCVSSKRGCNCYDQRGNAYRTTSDICRQFMDGGIFFAFRPSEAVTPSGFRRESPATASAGAATPSLDSVAVSASQPEAKNPPPSSPPRPVPSDSPWRFKG